MELHGQFWTPATGLAGKGTLEHTRNLLASRIGMDVVSNRKVLPL
jgi:hypothetical protein